MDSFDFPQARVVRKAGQLMTPPPVPQSPNKVYQGVRTILYYAVGLWPLTGVLLLTIGLLYLVQLSHQG
jgi:predicted membrane protein